MSLDDLPVALAEELEILAAEALRRGAGVTSRLQRDITAVFRRYNPRARVHVTRQGKGLAVQVTWPDAGDRVRHIGLQLHAE